ncbi:UbiA prenyltransferase family-domain-containing protein [Mycena filopes]|nr:UbiA prenyltransferase family-domain-containing protein [Mycena filopes]
MSSSPQSVIKRLREAAYTAYLFNQCDIISTLCPVIAVGMVLVGIPDLKTFVRGLIFQQLHLTAFEIQNQITGLEEDKISKPNRPLVAGRLSVETAHNIYIALVIISLWNSAEHGVLACSIFHLVAMVAYNEAACWGVTMIYGGVFILCCIGLPLKIYADHGRPLSQTSIIAVVMSGLIFTTTGHAQDFRDRDGDAAIGRKTLAIVLPQSFARWSLMILMFAWTIGLIHFWGPPPAFSILFCGLAALTTVKFVLNHSIEADRVSYWWYNIWLVAAHIMPLFRRFPEGTLRLSFKI